jgi:hypothetical protein
MGDTHAVGETATPKMGDIYAAVGETVGETCYMDSRPLGQPQPPIRPSTGR